MSQKLIDNTTWFASKHGITLDNIRDTFGTNQSIRMDGPQHLVLIVGREGIFEQVIKGIKLSSKHLIFIAPQYMFGKCENKYGDQVMRYIPIEQILGCRFVFHNCDARIMTQDEIDELSATMFVCNENIPRMSVHDAMSNMLLANVGDWIRCESASQANPSTLYYYLVC